MPLSITDLHAGDRVVLNCPHARHHAKREAIYEGLIGRHEAITFIYLSGGHVTGRDWVRQFAEVEQFAMFLMQVVGPGEALDLVMDDGKRQPLPATATTALRALFGVRPDNTLYDDEQRTVFIERRVTMGQG